MKLRFLCYVALILMLAPLGAIAEDNPVAREQQRAQRLLNKAVKYYQDKKDAALAAFSRQGEFIDGDLYVFVLSTKGVMLASGGTSSALIDQNVSDLRDAAGKPFFREILDTAQAEGYGTVEYRWLNRVDQELERKVTCFRKVGDVIIAVGYYISHATSEQARTLLDRASEAVRTDPQKAFVEFNKLHGKYSEDDLYVFVVDMTDNQFMAHGINHRLIGKDAMALRDTTGKAVLKEMFAALNDKDSAEIDYVWPNPLTKKIENKHTMVRRVSNYLVGVGYYTR